MTNPERIIAAEKAIRDGDAKRLRLYLKAGLSPNTVLNPESLGGRSLLAFAANWGQLECVKLLLESGADPQFQSGLGSVLDNCIGSSQPSFAVAEYLLINCRLSPETLGGALLHAASRETSEYCDLVLQAGADPNFDKGDGCTSLVYAIQTGREANAIKLLQAGAKDDVRIPLQEENEYSRLTIHQAAENQNFVAFLKLCKNPSGKTVHKAFDDFESAIGYLESVIPNLPSGLKLEVSEDLKLFQQCGTYFNFLRFHDGSGEVSLVPMPKSESFSLLSYTESLKTLDLMLSIAGSESTGESSMGWSKHWFPIGENGAGDLLFIDGLTGEVFEFNHEKRMATLRARTFLEMIFEIADGLRNGLYCYNESDLVVV